MIKAQLLLNNDIAYNIIYHRFIELIIFENHKFNNNKKKIIYFFKIIFIIKNINLLKKINSKNKILFLIFIF